MIALEQVSDGIRLAARSDRNELIAAFLGDQVIICFLPPLVAGAVEVFCSFGIEDEDMDELAVDPEADQTDGSASWIFKDTAARCRCASPLSGQAIDYGCISLGQPGEYRVRIFVAELQRHRLSDPVG